MFSSRLFNVMRKKILISTDQQLSIPATLRFINIIATAVATYCGVTWENLNNYANWQMAVLCVAEKAVLLDHFRPERRDTVQKAGLETWSCTWSPDASYIAWSCGNRIVKLIPWNRFKHTTWVRFYYFIIFGLHILSRISLLKLFCDTNVCVS